MKLIPFKRKQEDRNLTDEIIKARQANASLSLEEAATAAEEVVCGLYERAFAQARLEGVNIDRRMLGLIGRQLAQRGECVLFGPSRVPAVSWDVRGQSAGPLTWTYMLELGAPSGTRSVTTSAIDVWHFRVNVDPAEPWRGRSSLDLSPATRQLLRRSELALSNEAAGSVGKILTIPQGTTDTVLNAIKQDFRTLAGKTAFLESTQGGWGQGPSAAPARDWQPSRIGPEPPPALVELRRDAAGMVLAAAGVPVELVEGGANTAAAREAWRRFLHATIQPLGELVAEELRAKTATRVSINFDSLMASDLAGRARAFQSMVGAGMDVAKAAALAGLMSDD